MKTKAMSKKLSEVPEDTIGAFAWFVSHSASGAYKELLQQGRSDTEARNTIIHCFLDFASGEACRVARSEGRDPDKKKWRKATDAALKKAIERTDVDQQSTPEKST